MPPILFTTHDSQLLERIRKALAAEYPDVGFWLSSLDSTPEEIADKISESKAEVFIARGIMFKKTKAIGLPVTIIEAFVTSLETLQALKQAMKIGRRVAAVASHNVVTGAAELAEVLGIDLSIYPLDHRELVEGQVRTAIADGAEVILGGYAATNVARQLGHPHVQITIDVAGLIQSINEARGIVSAVQEEKRRSGMFQALLGHTSDGIVAVDASGRVIMCNTAAEHILGVKNSLGRHVDECFPDLRLMNVLDSGKDELGRILSINGTDIMSNNVPVLVGEKAAAALATFQDVRRIQQMEERVRQSIYDAGHSAAASFDAILAGSPAFANAITEAKEFALTGSSVLLLGETGTGKELFAQSIHNYSPRRKGPFVAINCAALPGQLLESELFGYAGGAFTGANPKGKPGMFELAHNGTLFLDEIGEIDLTTQGKLLRALEERRIMRLGSDKVIHVDVRLITATNRNLQTLMREEKFRPDLYYRLNILRLRIPPLRERKEDIVILATHFLRMFAPRGHPPLFLAKDAEMVLQRYHWPGNVRELRNVMERISVMRRHGVVHAEALVPHLTEGEPEEPPGAAMRGMETIYQVLAQCGGNKTKAAQMLGMGRNTLWRKLNRHSRFAEETGKSTRLDQDARDLHNIMGRAASGSGPEKATASMLQGVPNPAPAFSGAPATRSLMQKRTLLEALEKAAGHYGKAADILGVNRSTLYRRMKKLGIAY